MDTNDISSVSTDDDQVVRSNVTSRSVGRFFGKRQEDLFIELEEPHKIYGPGDTVRGQVNLTLQKNTKMLYTRIIFQGHVRIGAGKSRVSTMLFQKHLDLWGHSDGHINDIVMKQNQPERAAKLALSRRKHVEDDQAVGDGHLKLMRAGKHVFEFEFQFDSISLPSTVDFGRGCIAYRLVCELQKPSTIISRGRSICKKDLTFSDNIDVSNLIIPSIRHLESDFRTKDKSMKVHASVELVRSGFLKGESITLNIHIYHVKAIKNMYGIIATLYRLSRFHSSDLAPQSFRKDLCQSISPLLIDPITLEYRVSPRLRIPADAFPTVRSAGPVSFRYFVEVVLDLNSRASKLLSLSSRSPSITIGTNHETSEIIETEALKRDRGIHCIVFEVLIGTRGFTADTRERSNKLARSNDMDSQGSSSRSLRIAHRDNGAQESSNADWSSDRDILSSTIPVRTKLSRAPQPNEGESQFPLSKLALQELESALLPSLPPETGSDIVPYTLDHAQVPPSNLLECDSSEVYSTLEGS